jgi:hypothetical protein
MVFNATFDNISVMSWWSVLLVEDTTDLLQVTNKLYHMVSFIGGGYHRSATSHEQTLSHGVIKFVRDL